MIYLKSEKEMRKSTFSASTSSVPCLLAIPLAKHRDQFLVKETLILKMNKNVSFRVNYFITWDDVHPSEVVAVSITTTQA